MIRETSRLAHEEAMESGIAARQARKVYAQICVKSSTIRELSETLGITPNIVSARISDLRKSDKIKENGKRRCTVSGKLAIEWGR